MCGFAGLTWREGASIDGLDAAEARRARARRMTATLLHRGPDSDGWIDAPHACVGFRRLSIIDLAKGDQPVANESGSVQVLLNGEIYNHRELRKELEARGHQLRSGSDAEVLPHLYEEEGLEFVHKLNGMFAICVVDRELERVLLIRDPMGIKPLYYADRGDVLVFGSEMKALLASGLVERALDPQQILSFLSLFYCPGSDTMVPGVRKLGPGELLEYHYRGSTAAERHTWYDLAERIRNAATETSADDIDELLADSLRLQLIADVPVGVSLSGGLDSSLLSLYAARQERSDVALFTVHFPATPREEVDCAREVAGALGLRHEVLSSSLDDFLDQAGRTVWFADEPVADPAFYSAWKVAEEAAGTVKVLLSGAGADEVFAGYGHYGLTRKRAALVAAPRWLLDARLTDHLFGALGRGEELRALRDWRRDRARWHAEAISQLDAGERARLAEHWPGAQEPLRAIRAAFERVPDVSQLDAQLFTDTTTYLRDQLLPLTDRTTMAASIEGRVPFLDHRLVEAAFRLPASQKHGRVGQGKRVLRRLARGRLPASVLRRSKLGFPNPIEEFLRGDLSALLPELFAVPGSFAATFLPTDWLAERMGSPAAQQAHWQVLYSLFVLQVWYEIFVRRGLEDPPSGNLREIFELA